MVVVMALEVYLRIALAFQMRLCGVKVPLNILLPALNGILFLMAVAILVVVEVYLTLEEVPLAVVAILITTLHFLPPFLVFPRVLPPILPLLLPIMLLV